MPTRFLLAWCLFLGPTATRAGDGWPQAVFFAVPNEVIQGQPVELEWWSWDAESAWIDDLGFVPPAGKAFIVPKQTRYYVLIVWSGNMAYLAKVYVQVDPR